MRAQARKEQHYQGLKLLYRRYKLGRALSLIAALAFSALLFAPLFWMVRISFTTREYMFVLPPPPMFQVADLSAYRAVLRMNAFLRYYLNSIIVGAGTVVVSLAAGMLAAYSFSRFRYAARRPLMLLALTAQMFPWALLLISVYMLFNRMGLLNTYQGLIFTHTTFALPLTIWITKSYFDTVPREMEESAFVDGCSKMQVLWRILLPVSRPGIAAAAIYVFIFSWNDFLFGLTLTSEDSMRILAPGMAMIFIGERRVMWGEMMASAVIVSLPVVILFLLLQRHFIAGLTAGAVKE